MQEGAVGMCDRSFSIITATSTTEAFAEDQPLTAVAIDWNVAVRFVPSVVRAATITTATSAAIKPYSIAVAPDSSLLKREIMFFMTVPLGMTIS
jgi:hypothetical protein